MPKKRKQPFSGKLKKKQLQEKRQQKKTLGPDERRIGRAYIVDPEKAEASASGMRSGLDKLIKAEGPVVVNPQSDRGRYKLRFIRESRHEIEERKRLSRKPFKMLDPAAGLEFDLHDMFRPGSSLDMPKRPRWDYTMDKEQVLAREEASFRNYLAKVKAEFGDHTISYFETNLETWRQLWRVLEISDVIFLVLDIRYAPLHFPPALFDYVVKELKKPIVIILNKCDLVSPQAKEAWQRYFQATFPEVHIATFSSFYTKHEGNPASRKKYKKKLNVAEGLAELVAVWKKLGLAGAGEWEELLLEQEATGIDYETEEDEDEPLTKAEAQHKRFYDAAEDDVDEIIQGLAVSKQQQQQQQPQQHDLTLYGLHAEVEVNVGFVLCCVLCLYRDSEWRAKQLRSGKGFGIV
eukprot:m.117038 g.117038  ORF g.117038 m.117038 type:complete len:406 (-) comp13623_c0_seq5:1869-3086(-)